MSEMNSYDPVIANPAAVKAALATMIQEVDVEYNICTNNSRVDKHSLPGDYRTFIGTNFDKTIYRQLLTAIAGTSSNFETNPKKTCLLLSIGICISLPLQEQQNFEKTMRVKPLTDEDKALLQLVAQKVQPYSDEELSASRPTDVELQKTQALVQRALATVPMFKVIRFKVGSSYEQALQDAAIVQLQLDTETNQSNEKNRELIEYLNNTKHTLERAAAGEIPVVFMDKLTYPSTVATCTCGSCGAANDAKDLLRARVTIGDYEAAHKYVFSRFSSGTSDDTMQYSPIVHNAGIIMPVVCSQCGTVNIPTETFLLAFKLCILRRWIQTPPSPKNKNVILTYSASAIVEGITALLQNDQEKVEEILQSYKPSIVAEKVEVKAPEYSLADLVSSETYTNYMSMLNVHNNSRLLKDDAKREQLFLQYILSTLHINTVNASPTTVIESILQHPKFSKYHSVLEDAAKTIYKSTEELERVTLIHKVITSEHFMCPMNGYIDTILNFDVIKTPIGNITNSSLSDLLKSDADISAKSNAILKYIEELQEQLATARATVEDTSKTLSDSLLAYEQELYGTSAEGWDTFRIAPLAGDQPIDLVLSVQPDQNKESYIYKCEVCNTIWNSIAPAYVPLMYQTAVRFSNVLRNNSLLFGGLFANKISEWGKQAVKMCSALDVEMKFSDTTNYHKMFGEMLYACIQAESSTRLVRILDIPESRLLKAYTIPLPSNERLTSIITYSILDEVDFPVGLSVFANGADIGDYQTQTQQAYMEESETSISAVEATAIAECAAFFYITFSSIDINKSQLLKQLEGEENANTFEI